jgi:MFS transporter, ACS family, allantoate permease
VRENNAGVASHHIKWSHIWEAIKDPLTWIYSTIIFAGVTPNGIFGTFGSIIIKSLGFNNLQVHTFLWIPFLVAVD